MAEAKKNLKMNKNYLFVIRSPSFFPFEEASLRIVFTISMTRQNFTGYYRLAIGQKPEVTANEKENSSLGNAHRAGTDSNLINQMKQIALA